MQGPYIVLLLKKWIKTNFRTREPDFHNIIFPKNFEGQENIKSPTLYVQTGTEQKKQHLYYLSKSPVIQYPQDNLNSSCFRSLMFDIYEIGEDKSEKTI